MSVLDLLFLCCDMGETKALIPVMHEMHARKVDFMVLALGASRDELRRDVTLRDKMIEFSGVDTAKDRTKPLEDLVRIIDSIVPPLVVVSGPASKAQEQLLEALPAKRKIVYLDNFNYSTSNPSFETVKGVAAVAQKVICVSDVVKQQMLETVPSLKERDIKPLGRPSLEGWVRQVKEVDRSSALKKVGFTPDKKVVTFIGGYGPRYDNGVEAAYVQARIALEKEDCQVHVQHHPNVVKTQPLTTVEAVGMADCVVCYDSTVGFESLFADKRVIYLQPEGVEPYDNIAIQNNLAECVKTGEELVKALETPSSQTGDIYKLLGVERNSTQAITDYVLKKLGKVKQGGSNKKARHT